MPPQSSEFVKFEEEILPPKPEKLVNRHVEMYSLPELITDLRALDWNKIVWHNVLAFAYLHLYLFWGFKLLVTGQLMWQTVLFNYILAIGSSMGVTMGAHRLWAHRSYKAKTPLRIFLMLWQTISVQNDIYEWSRDHRVHHKFSETDADPHSAKRGLFFAHIGWLMYKKHDDVKTNGKKVDCSDLLDDPVVRFQRNHYKFLAYLLALIIPTWLPNMVWGEYLGYAFLNRMCFYMITLHGTWCVNSFAHYVGSRPINQYIYPAQNRWVSLLGGGEGWHNYHHTFPFDYKAAELGGFLNENYIASFIEWAAWIGQAYDLKSVSDEVIVKYASTKGDGSFEGLGVKNGDFFPEEVTAS